MIGAPQTEVATGGPQTVRRSPSSRAADWLVLAAAVGLASGFAEVGFQGARRLLLDHWLRLGIHTIWVVPFAQLLLFTLLGVGAAVTWRLRPGRRTAWVMAAVLAGVAMLPEVLAQPWLDPRAALVLAAGVAVQVGRWFTHRMPAVFRAGRRSLPWLGALLVLLWVGIPAALSWRERRLLNGLPAGQGRPSVLLIFLDTVRAASLSAYGSRTATTPFLERVVQDGTRFDRAYAPSSWTLPTHASVFTGRWPHELSADWNTPLDHGPATLAEVFQRAGYATAGFMANTMYTSSETGLARGFHHYEAYRVTPEEVIASWSIGAWLASRRWVRRAVGSLEILNRVRAPQVRDAFLEWLDGIDRRPFFTVLNYFEAHEPYLPPSPYDARFGNGRIRWNPELKFGPRSVALSLETRQAMPGGERAEHAAAYLGTIRYLDDELERLFQELQARGLLDQTIVVITSDHGEGLGEGEQFMHGVTFTDLTTHVPLLIRYPRAVPAGLSVGREVSLRDVPATLADLAGLPESAGRLPGHSLAGLLRTAAPDQETVSPALSSWWAWRGSSVRNWSVVLESLRLVRKDDGSELLFDLRQDPHELVNLLESPTEPVEAAAARLRAILDSVRGGTPLSPRPDPWAGQGSGGIR